MRLRIPMALGAAAMVLAASTAEGAGSAANGKKVFGRCAVCHNDANGAGNKLGPDLFGVAGRKAGTVPGFGYSAAMKSAGFDWTNDKLDAFIKSPATTVPGTRMAFAGISSDSDRADLIAYLDTLK